MRRRILIRVAWAAGGVAALVVVLLVAPCRTIAPPPETSGSVAEPVEALPPTGLFHDDDPLGVTTGVGMIPPKIFKTYDLSLWQGEAERDVGLLTDVSASWYRHHSSHFPAFDQRTLEADGFGFEYQDLLVRTVQDAGIDILLMIGRTHGLASCRQFGQFLPDHYAPHPGAEEEAYREYVRRVVERYDHDGVDDMPGLKAPIRWFQLGNENDLHSASCADLHRDYATPEQYLAVARMTKEAMVAAHPESRLAASMTFGPMTEDATHWTERLLGLESGAVLDSIDALDMHDYSRDLANQRRRVTRLHALSGGRVPVWITETSTPSDPAARHGWNPTRQAQMLPVIVCHALATGHVQRVFWHALADGPPLHESRQWRNFGTNSLYGCVDPVALPGKPPQCAGFELKPVGRAFALMAEALEGYTSVEELGAKAGYRIRRDGRPDALVVTGSMDVGAALGVDTVAVHDLVDAAAFDGEQPHVLPAGELTVGDNPLLVSAPR